MHCYYYYLLYYILHSNDGDDNDDDDDSDNDNDSDDWQLRDGLKKLRMSPPINLSEEDFEELADGG